MPRLFVVSWDSFTSKLIEGQHILDEVNITTFGWITLIAWAMKRDCKIVSLAGGEFTIADTTKMLESSAFLQVGFVQHIVH